MQKNIVLIGFMGVGKSLVARHLSQKLGRPVVSTDEMIVSQEGKPITKIFQDHGEAYFRDLELKVVEKIAPMENMIVDCGGGVALNPRNMDLLKQNGIIFYLSATPEEIYKNVKDQQHRPLLNTPDPKSEIAQLLHKRRPFYEKADMIIDANGKSGEQLCIDILTMLPKLCR